MLKSSLILLLSSAAAFQSCSDEHATVRHGGFKYLIGGKHIEKSIYAQCFHGTFSCYVSNLIPGKHDAEIPCRDVSKPEYHRNLQVSYKKESYGRKTQLVIIRFQISLMLKRKV